MEAADVGVPGSLLASISTPDLLVALFSLADPASGLINETVSPPMIMVLDSRAGADGGGPARTTT